MIKGETITVIVAILSLLIIEVMALSKGCNSQLTRWISVIIAGLGGLIINIPTIGGKPK